MRNMPRQTRGKYAQLNSYVEKESVVQQEITA